MARRKSKKESNMTQISISLPKELVEQIHKMAATDNRNRSNFIAHTLENIVKRFKDKQ